MKSNKLKLGLYSQHRRNTIEKITHKRSDYNDDLLFDDQLICQKEKPQLTNFNTIYLSTNKYKKLNAYQDQFEVKNQQKIQIHPKTLSLQRHACIYNRGTQTLSTNKIKNRQSNISFRFQNSEKNNRNKQIRPQSSRIRYIQKQGFQKMLIAETLNLHQTKKPIRYSAKDWQKKLQTRACSFFQRRKEITSKDLSSKSILSKRNDRLPQKDPLGPWFLQQDQYL